jgi:Alkylmercury lyase
MSDTSVSADEAVRRAVYDTLSGRGRAPSIHEIALLAGISDDDAHDSLISLAAAHAVVLTPAGDAVRMAHPFSAAPMGFVVAPAAPLDDRLWWGGCAWDSFALPHLLPGEDEVLVATRCPACGRPHAWNVGRDRPPDGDQVAHFGVPAARMWDDVVRTCGHQRLFCSGECVDAWLAATGSARGYVMDLGTLWRLAAHWYDGRLDRGYVRREPSQAAAYLRGVGLSGSFWGLQVKER